MKNLILPLLLLLLFISHNSFSQNRTYNVNPNTNQVTNLSLKMDFRRTGSVDYDIEKWYNKYVVDTTIVVKVNSDGTGELIIFVESKVFFEIISCYKYDNRFEFVVINAKGAKCPARIMIENNEIKSFFIDNPIDHTALCFYD